ncbi:DUF998 domain-containing protein [Mucilaginibacter aquariorum]|uniref:DUF998 domain-containing protein n=1 Tax=Mucilaginibacter aquariorum TaxID=2967225 RepID=A0ABT1T2A4_9SPHI|nr:DUF998 domain-containing protein [Mucilaginibacter aquariorum]MCQ6958743.1 DUF998 domain-containing protein [Mucilaginibacter aquariorum]
MENADPNIRFYRRFVIIILAYEALGCLLGGALLVMAPDGHLMEMPVRIMHGVFPDFTVPGFILLLLGVVNAAAFWAVLQKANRSLWMALFALGGLLGWFWMEIAILQQLHWLHAMWGLPVLLAFAAALQLYPWTDREKQIVLLICGIAASLLYADVVVIVPALSETYNSNTQTISELSAIGAPTRFVWITLTLPYTLLMIAFSWGVIRSAAKSRPLKITGGLLLLYALTGLFWPLAPMHQRQVLAAGGGSFTDQAHLALGALTEMLYLLALLFAAYGLDRGFRIYSALTLCGILVFGVLTFSAARRLAAEQPTPNLGLWERINIGIFLLWVCVLAFKLINLKPEKK